MDIIRFLESHQLVVDCILEHLLKIGAGNVYISRLPPLEIVLFRFL
jgi:hypothetical protein